MTVAWSVSAATPSPSPSPSGLAALSDNAFWVWFVGAPLAVAIVVAVAVISVLVLHRIIDRVVRTMAARARKERPGVAKASSRTQDLTEALMSQRGVQRAEAIGQLLRSVVTIVVWTVAILMILGTLGVDIAPLIASAGVVSVALAFGAQTMVKDYLSGIAMILEDQFGVGDVVDLGPVVGTVEEVTLRITRVRDLSGVVWYVRNGEVLRVANRSQGWTLAMVDIPIAYDEDIDRVRAIVDAVGEDMDSDPAYDSILFGPPSFAGVESVSGEAVTIRVNAKAAPDQQVTASRAIRERVKLAFDKAGVRVPVVMRYPGTPGTPGAPGSTPGTPPRS